MRNKIKRYLDKKISLSIYKRVFILGGTGEIGSALVEELAYKRVSLILGVRNIDKFQKLKNQLLEKYPNAHIEYILIDLTNAATIENVALYLQASNVDCVIFNSGIASSNDELNMNVNYYSLKNFFHILGSNIKYIVASSISIRRYLRNATCKKEDSYSYSKYLLYMHCRSLQKKGYDITQVHPGIVFTPLFAKRHMKLKFLFPLLKRILISREKAALIFMHALSNEVEAKHWICPGGIFQIFGYPQSKKIV